jgi:hypothetical protein
MIRAVSRAQARSGSFYLIGQNLIPGRHRILRERREVLVVAPYAAFILVVRMVEDNSAVGAVVIRQLVAHVAAMTFKTRAIYNSRRNSRKECRVAVS